MSTRVRNYMMLEDLPPDLRELAMLGELPGDRDPANLRAIMKAREWSARIKNEGPTPFANLIDVHPKKVDGYLEELQVAGIEVLPMAKQMLAVPDHGPNHPHSAYYPGPFNPRSYYDHSLRPRRFEYVIVATREVEHLVDVSQPLEIIAQKLKLELCPWYVGLSVGLLLKNQLGKQINLRIAMGTKEIEYHIRRRDGFSVNMEEKIQGVLTLESWAGYDNEPFRLTLNAREGKFKEGSYWLFVRQGFELEGNEVAT